MTWKTIALVAGVALSLALLMLIIDETIMCCPLQQLGGTGAGAGASTGGGASGGASGGARRDLPSIIILDRSHGYDSYNSNSNSTSKLTQLLANQQQLLKMALKSKAKANAKPKPVCKVKKASPKFKDWASEGQATQSSTYKFLQASSAIDGNMDTFSHTEISPNHTSWLKLTLPKSVEINKIIIENRKDAPGSFQMRKRLPPFTVSIKNAAGMVTASKIFTDVLQTYTWSDIFVVGSEITIEQQKKNYLSVADLKVYGLEAKGCDYYEKELAFNVSTASTLLQKLKESACLKGASKETQQEVVKMQAKKFDEIIKKQMTAQKKQVTQAKTVIKTIEAQLLKERQLAAQAKRYGLEPPKPIYKKAQINKLKRMVNPVEKKLTEEEKADCMNINTRIQALTQQISDMSSKMDENSPIGPMELLGNELKQLQDLYSAKCFAQPPDLSEFNIDIEDSAPALS
jgi:hypothetical protein